MERGHRKQYIITTFVLFAIEVFIALYVNDSFIRPFLGDVIVVGLLYSFFMALSNYKVVSVAICTLLFSYAVEIAQYFQVVDILGLREYQWARIIIGTSFSWWDMLCYTLGFLMILCVEEYKKGLTV